ncbi:hypothetical protein BDQ17DRAFT_1321996 [Cyathus striatus]|nr:hypothetical protein BDQ17DRAFT_1321996 [Cyathus striatus]
MHTTGVVETEYSIIDVLVTILDVKYHDEAFASVPTFITSSKKCKASRIQCACDVWVDKVEGEEGVNVLSESDNMDMTISCLVEYTIAVEMAIISAGSFQLPVGPRR